jgi:hypothetical protein
MTGADAGKVGFRAFRLRRRAVADGSSIKQLSMRARLAPLIGDQRRAMVAMSFLAIFAAFAEVVNLILITQIAATLVKPNATHARPALLHIHASTGTLILLAFIISVAQSSRHGSSPQWARVCAQACIRPLVTPPGSYSRAIARDNCRRS